MKRPLAEECKNCPERDRCEEVRKEIKAIIEQIQDRIVGATGGQLALIPIDDLPDPKNDGYKN